MVERHVGRDMSLLRSNGVGALSQWMSLLGRGGDIQDKQHSWAYRNRKL